MTATGWTVQQLEATPWPDISDLRKYWQNHPPVHVLVAAFFEKKDTARTPTEDELEQGIQGF